MNSKTIYLGLLVLLIALISGCAGESETVVITDLSLVLGGGSYTCDINMTDTATAQTISVDAWFKDGKIREEFTIQNTETVIIVTSTTFYAYTPSTNTGFMMTIPEESELDTSGTGGYSAEDLQTEGVTVACIQASVSDDKFTPPSDVEFTDLSALLSGLDTGTSTTDTTTDTSTTTYTGRTDKDKLINYLRQNLLDEFPDTDERIKTLSITSYNASLRYYSGSSAPEVESWYLAGAIFIVFPDVDSVDVGAILAREAKLMPNSVKWPNRSEYDFNEEWFGEVEVEAECATDADCIDNDDCTHDICYNSKCSNPRIVTSECT